MNRSVIFGVLIAMFGFLNVSAKSSDKNSYFGLKAGFDINIPGDWHNDGGSIKMFRNGCGFNIGVVYNAWLGKGFYLEPGLSLYYDSYSYYGVFSNEGIIADKDPRLYKIGIRIPVVAGYEFNITDNLGMTIFSGPELNYSFAGKYVVKNRRFWGDMEDSPFITQRRVDCAWKVGVGFPINDFTLSVEGDIGMTDLMKNPDISFRENRCTIGLTYYF